MKLTPELVRIHAHLCGDGVLSVYPSKEKDHKKRAQISYYNTNKRLIEEFQADMQKEFGVKMTYIPSRHRVAVQSLRIANFLLSLSDYKTNEWRVSVCIKNSSRELRLEWFKAFAHDDGYTPKDRNQIRLKCKNFDGLSDVKEMLDDLGFYSTLTGPNCDKTWFLNVRKEFELSNFVKIAVRK